MYSVGERRHRKAFQETLAHGHKAWLRMSLMENGPFTLAPTYSEELNHYFPTKALLHNDITHAI